MAQHRAELDEHGAHAGAQRELQGVGGDVALQHRVERGGGVRAVGDGVVDEHAAVGLVELRVNRPPVRLRGEGVAMGEG